MLPDCQHQTSLRSLAGDCTVRWTLTGMATWPRQASPSFSSWPWMTGSTCMMISGNGTQVCSSVCMNFLYCRHLQFRRFSATNLNQVFVHIFTLALKPSVELFSNNKEPSFHCAEATRARIIWLSFSLSRPPAHLALSCSLHYTGNFCFHQVSSK